MADNIFLDTPTVNGEIIATDQIGTSSGPHYQFVKLVDGTLGSSAAVPGSTGGLAVTSTSVVIASGTVTATAATNPWSSAPGFNVPLVSASSGLVQISGTPTVTATAATNPWSSAPGFNVPIVSASSGLVQILSSGPFLLSSAGVTGLILPVSSTAGYAQVTSSAGLMVNVSSGTISSTATTITSGTVTLSSAIGISSGIVTATAGTNPWSSAPGFNVPMVSASSGLIQTFFPVTSVAGQGPVTSSFGVLGNFSSGGYLIRSLSSGTVTATAGTNPWSSAPGFNVPIVSVSSGLIQALGLATITSSGLLSFVKMSTGGAVAVNVTTAPAAFYGYAVFNSTATPQAVKFYNSTAPTVGASTANLKWTVFAPGSTGGGGANLSLPAPGIFSSNGWSVVITANMNDTDTGAPGTNTVNVNMLYLV